MTPPAGAAVAPVDTTATLALDQLDAQHWPNPRGDVDTTGAAFAELAASIAAQGILEPIVVGPALDELDGRRPIIAGWRRYTAALTAGMASVPVHVRDDITDARAALRAALAENMAREAMTPLAEATAIARLVELGDTQVEAAKAVGVSERTARERLRMLELPTPVRDAIAAGDVPTTCTRQLQVIADASPAAASAIARKIQKGEVLALDLLEPRRLEQVLSRLDGKAGLVKLESWAPLRRLGLKPETHEALKARYARAKGWGDGERIDLSVSVVGKRLLDQASAAGKVIKIATPHGEVVYLAGAEWLEKAATRAVECAEADDAKRQELGRATRAELDRAAAAEDEAPDPELQRQEEQRRRAEEIDERAAPYAAQMNAEIGQRLRELASCKIEGPIARVLLELALAADDPSLDFAIAGYRMVDPESRWAKARDAYDQDVYDAWEAAIRGADTPEHAAAELVKPIIACVFADPRAGGAGGLGNTLWVELEDAVSDAGVSLGVVPARAIALAAARRQLNAAQELHRGQAERRRILFELRDGRLAQDVLAKRAGEWGRDAGDLLDVAMQVRPGQFDRALQHLVDAGHVKAKTVNGGAQVTITAAGRKVLESLPDLPPIMADIDAGADDPADAAAGEDLEPDNDLPTGSRREQVLAAVRAQPGITLPQIAEQLRLKQNVLYRVLPALAGDGLVRKEGRGWYPQLELDAEQHAAVEASVDTPAADTAAAPVIIHVTPTGGGEPVEAELQPDPPKGRNCRKVIYTASRTAAWVAASRIADLPSEASA